jgi:hypothetical protein
MPLVFFSRQWNGRLAVAFRRAVEDLSAENGVPNVFYAADPLTDCA